MKAEELRIGNWVFQGGTYGYAPVTAYELYQFSLYEVGTKTADYYQDWQSIPLTEEWLERFGFKMSSDGTSMEMEIAYQTTSFPTTLQICGIWGYDAIEICRSKIGALSVKCKYVHQLQNLYFALTNTELKISETVK